MDHSDPLRTLFADDIVFHQPGRNPTSGDYQGLDAVLGRLRTLGNAPGRPSGPRSTTCWPPTSTVARVTAQRGAMTVDVPVVHVWHMHNGKLAEAWAHSTDQHLLDEFWA
jgi:ketosteroid isomerase-like protein